MWKRNRYASIELFLLENEDISEDDREEILEIIEEIV